MKVTPITGCAIKMAAKLYDNIVDTGGLGKFDEELGSGLKGIMRKGKSEPRVAAAVEKAAAWGPSTAVEKAIKAKDKREREGREE